MDHSPPSKRTKPIPGGKDESEYRSVMRRIMEGLTRDNIDTIIFLCKEYVPNGRELKTGLELLKYFEDRDLVSVHSAVFVAEILHIIRRMDLLKLIPCIRNKKHFEEDFLGFSYSSFNAYRVLTVQLQDELSKRDFETFRYECTQHLNIRSLDDATSVLSLLRKLEEEDVISDDDYGNLINILKSIENVKPLKLFMRLLEGDETVAVPAGKQAQRQDSSQSTFPDRNYVSPPAPEPSPYSTNPNRRIESMPTSLPPEYETQASQYSDRSETAFIEKATREKSHDHDIGLPARYTGSGPEFTMLPGSRWFPDEVTPKRPVGQFSRLEHYDRGMSFQSMPPPPYMPQEPRRNYGNPYPSMPAMYAQSPPHFEDSLLLQDRNFGFPHGNTFPQLLNPQLFHPQGVPPPIQQQNSFDSPPQSMSAVNAPPGSLSYNMGHSAYPSMPMMSPPFGNHTLTPLAEQVGGLTLNAGHDNNLDSQGRDMFLNCEEEEDLCDKATASLEGVGENEPEAEQENVVEDAARGNDDPDNRYKMDASPVGLCILINNEKFVENRMHEEHERRKANGLGGKDLPQLDLGDRIGSHIDAGRLEKLFRCFDFDVRRHDDLNHRAMKRVLVDAGSMDHSNYDCFILIVLSHGDNGCVFGVDGFPISLIEIQKPFFADTCVTLAKKPKVIIIQACQGAKEMPAYAPDSDLTHDGPVYDEQVDQSTPNKTDFLLAYSTVPGYRSYRSRSCGSFFVYEIISILKKYYKTEDLLSMMVMVNNEVAKYGKKQVPMPVATLRKKIYFHLKEGCSLDEVDEGYQFDEAASHDSGATGKTVLESQSKDKMAVQESGDQE